MTKENTQWWPLRRVKTHKPGQVDVHVTSLEDVPRARQIANRAQQQQQRLWSICRNSQSVIEELRVRLCGGKGSAVGANRT